MAKDDYFALAYKLLRYLYKCLKTNDRPDWDIIAPNTKHFPIHEEYFIYLLENLIADGYITGIIPVKAVGHPTRFKEVENGIYITPKGIEYLEENAMMKKAAKTLGAAAEITGSIVSKII